MTTVKVRTRKTKAGNVYLCLDYYPPIFNPQTRKYTSRESLGMQLYAPAKNDREKRFNEQLMEKAEAIKCRRIIQLINEEYDFLDKEKFNGDFLAYYYDKIKCKDEKSGIVFKHFKTFMKGKCTFGTVDADLCNKFKDYLLKSVRTKNGRTLAQNSAAGYFSSFRAILKEAYKEHFLQTNVNDFIDKIKWKKVQKPYLTIEEVKSLAATPCKIDVLKRASLFSIFTGLRISDILDLKWEDISIAQDGGPCINKVIQKSDRQETLFISEEALAFCGPRSTGTVFKGLIRSMTYTYLPEWLESAGISKHITFHCFRHTNATLLLTLGADLYTVSKMLTHQNISTTQVYAEVVDEKRREASEMITLK